MLESSIFFIAIPLSALLLTKRCRKTLLKLRAWRRYTLYTIACVRNFAVVLSWLNNSQALGKNHFFDRDHATIAHFLAPSFIDQ